VVVGGDGDLSPVIIGLEDRRRSTSLVVSTLWWGHSATGDLVLVRWKTRWMLCIKIRAPHKIYLLDSTLGAFVLCHFFCLLFDFNKNLINQRTSTTWKVVTCRGTMSFLILSLRRLACPDFIQNSFTYCSNMFPIHQRWLYSTRQLWLGVIQHIFSVP